jgi:hypothetical protein
VEHTVIARGNPDREMIFKRQGFLCEKKDFFFCNKEVLLQEEEILNRFVNSGS